MKKNKNIIWYLIYIYYKLVASNLPRSYFPIIGEFCRKQREFCAKKLFDYCGNDVNIEPKAEIETSTEIGDRSGIGKHCILSGKVIIGKNVMMGPSCSFYTNNHVTSRTDIPMRDQGMT